MVQQLAPRQEINLRRLDERPQRAQWNALIGELQIIRHKQRQDGFLAIYVRFRSKRSERKLKGARSNLGPAVLLENALQCENAGQFLKKNVHGRRHTGAK